MSKTINEYMADLTNLEANKEAMEVAIKQTRQAIRNIIPEDQTSAVPTSYGTISFKKVKKWKYSNKYQSSETEAKGLLATMKETEQVNGIATLVSEDISMVITLKKTD